MDNEYRRIERIDPEILPGYEQPRIISLTKQQILEEFGPARAQYPCDPSVLDCVPREDLGGPILP